jgi:molybdopterin synthase catalytic subunit
MMLRRVVVQEQDFDLGIEWATLRGSLPNGTGALGAFCGVVRDQFETDAVAGLQLEHYPGMTEQSIERVLDRAEKRWPLDAIVVIHRVGTLAPGEQIVLVMAASRHRQAALEACTFVIDLLKTEAVFWKRELLASGARWIESSDFDHQRSADWRGRRES